MRSSIFFSLQVFDDHDICIDTVILVYKAVIFPTLLYGSETWTMHRCHLKILERCHQQCLRYILCISWEDRHTHINVLEVAKCASTKNMLVCKQLSWAGHLLRIPDSQLPKQILFAQLKEGTRIRESKKHFNDNL